MPALFTLPQAVALSAANQLLPGAKLYFRQSGSSTPQNVYQDIDLTVPHANPVVADGAGVFDPIYLDSSLPSYRVILTDSADVTQPGYPIDNYPSNQNAGQTYRLKSAAPELVFEETDATAGNKKVRVRLNAERLRIELLNDAEGVATELFSVGRVGTTVDDIRFTATAGFFNDERIAYGSRAVTASDQNVNNSTTLQDWVATAIQLKATAYRVHGFLWFYGVGADGFKWKINSDVSATSKMFYSGIVNGSSVDGRTDHLTTIAHATISNSSATPDVIVVDGYLSPSALANITLQFAQNSATASNTTLVRAFLEFSRLS
jgi:hypothetical protein